MLSHCRYHDLSFQTAAHSAYAGAALSVTQGQNKTARQEDNNNTPTGEQANETVLISIARHDTQTRYDTIRYIICTGKLTGKLPV